MGKEIYKKPAISLAGHFMDEYQILRAKAPLSATGGHQGGAVGDVGCIHRPHDTSEGVGVKSS